jgi:hypothetical protein
LFIIIIMHVSVMNPFLSFFSPPLRVLTIVETQNFSKGINAQAQGIFMAADWRSEVDRVLREGGDTLHLTFKFLGAEGAAEVAEKLRGNSSAVKQLYLGGNKLGDGGVRSVVELLRSNLPTLEAVGLDKNDIGCDGMAALADALRENTTVRRLYLGGNKGVDPDPQFGGTVAEAAAGVASLVAAIGVNTTLEVVWVGNNNIHQQAIRVALADTEGRRAGRERLLTGPVTKAAHKRD